MALVCAVLFQEIHHAEFECLTLFRLQVEGNLKHVADGCRHDEWILFGHHEVVELTEMRGGDTPQEIVVVNGE